MNSIKQKRYAYAQQIKQRNRAFKLTVFFVLAIIALAFYAYFVYNTVPKSQTGKLTIYDPYWNVKITIDGEFEIIDGGYFCKSNNTLYYTNNNVIFEVK